MRDHFLNILKLILAIAVIPITIFVTMSFVKSSNALPLEVRHAFGLGILIYTMAHLFIYELPGIFQLEQRLVSGIFSFSSPLAAVLSISFPFFSVLILIVFYVLDLLGKIGQYGNYFMFFAGWMWALHILFMAKQLREQEKGGMAKASYVLFAQLIFIFNCLLMAVIFVVIFHQFSFSLFFQEAFHSSKHFYRTIFHQLFIP